MQAQTVANFFLAFEQNLAIVPLLNNLDMSSADPDKVAQEMQQVSVFPSRFMYIVPKVFAKSAVAK